jgi:hypothetical protein
MTSERMPRYCAVPYGEIAMITKNVLGIRQSDLECLDISGKLLWTLTIDSIVLIAEYTTNEGPHVDDYFLVFVTAEENKLFFSTCSFYVDGRDEALSILQMRLGSSIQLGLQGSTEWRSRVAWPARMAGSEYFTFAEIPPKTLLEKVKKRLLGPTQEYAISKPVRDYLEEQLRNFAARQ